jgi:hypothetical protein
MPSVFGFLPFGDVPQDGGDLGAGQSARTGYLDGGFDQIAKPVGDCQRDRVLRTAARSRIYFQTEIFK